MKDYTVLLLYPDYMTDCNGHDTYMTWVHADDVRHAIARARTLVVQDNYEVCQRRAVYPEDFKCLCVIEGNHEDIKHEAEMYE